MYLHLIVLISIIAIVQAGPHNLTFPEFRIYRGVQAEHGEFPHLVSLQWRPRPEMTLWHSCGGSIIHSQWILTAAHCIHKGRNYVVKAGKHLIKVIEPSEQVSRVERIYVHERYRPRKLLNDIALIKLEKELELNDKVRAIALPKPHSQPRANERLIVAGWGAISQTSKPLRRESTYPDVLQKLNVTFVDLYTCMRRMLRYNRGRFKVYETNICTSGVSACSGDSGGSLINGNHELIGIVSWGAPCDGLNEMPEVFTRVSAFIDWIDAKQTSSASELYLITALHICSVIGILRFACLL